MIHLLAILFLFNTGDNISGEGYKSLKTARVLSAVIPGAGQFYVHNYWKGVGAFSFTVGSLAISAYAFNETKYAPLKRTEEGELTRGDYQLIGILFGVGAFGCWLRQLWDLNDDVVVYNYKLKFLKSSLLNFNFTPNKCGFSLTKTFG